MTAQTPPKSVMLPGSPRYGYTYHRSDGNRIVAGKGSLPDTVPIEVQLGFVPVWVVAVPLEGGSIWAAVSAEAEVVAFLVEAEGVREVPINVGSYVGGQPPLLEVGQDGVSIVSVASNSGSLFTHPVVLWESGSRVWIDEDGYLHLHEGNQDHKLDIPVLPDARIAQDERERLLLLSNPTKAYDHGVLGDDLEAGGVILVETEPEFRVAEHFMVPGGLVLEGIMPIWVDLDGDGSREIILTASDRINGARLLVYSEDGVLIAESDPIGRGYRWLHQLAVASPEVGNPKEIISVRTPHIGGALEYFQLRGSRLELVASVEGVTSHVLGTRNLDLALVGDFDGDGRSEVLLPDTERQDLLAVERTDDGAAVEWTLQLPDIISSNLAAVSGDDGHISLAVGLQNRTLWIWTH